MTKSSTPDRLHTDLRSFEAMQNDASEMIPGEMVSAVNLLVHPAAGIAAASALGLGLASQAFGFWLGALTGAGEVSQKLLQAFGDASGQDAKKTDTEETKPSATAPALYLVKATVVETSPSQEARRPQGLDKPAVPDDLKAISGIGPKLETVLNGYGVWTYAQIAEWTDAEIGWMDDTLGFRGRIRRDDWVGQAAALLNGK